MKTLTILKKGKTSVAEAVQQTFDYTERLSNPAFLLSANRVHKIILYRLSQVLYQGHSHKPSAGRSYLACWSLGISYSRRWHHLIVRHSCTDCVSLPPLALQFWIVVFALYIPDHHSNRSDNQFMYPTVQIELGPGCTHNSSKSLQ
jgi:hypothetical protein